jgi:hypothetical protein
MLKKITYTFFAVAIGVIITQAGVTFHTTPPAGYTGAPRNGVQSYCTACHNSFALNSGGGAVSVTGLPVGSYTAGATYNFSVNLKHAQADRLRWGFSIKAVNEQGQSIGTFSSNNPNAALNLNDPTELSHLDAKLLTTPTDTFFYDNLVWTAPASPATADQTVTFYYVGNATNGNSSTDGDYIYSGSTMVTLPLTLTGFTATANGASVDLVWKTSSESNSSRFIIEKSSDNQHFIEVATIDAAGSSTVTKAYSFTDDKPAYFERPTFYRLVLLDKDGSKKYSNVVNVTLKAKGSFVKKLYPNPVTVGGTMQAEIISDKNQDVSIQLFSFSGKRIKDITTMLAKGNNIIDIPIHKFTAAGMYALTIKTDQQTQQIPVIIR